MCMPKCDSASITVRSRNSKEFHACRGSVRLHSHNVYYTTPYYAQSNGKSEIPMETVKVTMTKAIKLYVDLV